MSECKCDLRTKLVGDGCEVCNPAMALEHAKDRIVDLEGDYTALLARHNALVEAVKNLTKADDDLQNNWTAQCDDGLQNTYDAARAEVDRLIANDAADCKGEG